MLLTREQLQERLLSLHAASLELVKDVSLETLLEKIASTACEQAEAQYAALGVLTDDGKLKEFIAIGLSKDEIKKMAHPPIGLGVIGALMNTDKPVRLPVLQDHPRSVGFPPNHPPMSSFLGVPIRAGDQQLGQIYLTNKIDAPEFTADDEKIIQMLALYAAAAIQNARLHDNTHRLAVLEERERIAMDLHDGIIQSIFGVGLALENAKHLIEEDPQASAERLQQSINALNQTIRDIRSYILDLRPRQLGEENLMNGLQRLVTEYRANTLREALLSGNPDELESIPHNSARALFHICQESLANAAKHANAKRIEINVWTTDERVVMEISDNGKGFDADKALTRLGHGLENIHTRARNVGGEAELSSEVGTGTHLLVWTPRK